MARITAVACATACFAALAAAPASAHKGNPDYESVVTSVNVPGLKVQVLNGDDRLQVINDTGKVVVIEGYEGEPYARLLPDGHVQINERSPATYLNDDPRGDVDVPKIADAKAQPVWKAADGNERFQFHDHRIHWMADGDPPQVRGKTDQRQKVFDWKVPMTVDGKPAAIAGTLWWRGTGGGMPVGAIVAFAAIVLAGVGLVVFVRRRRGGAADDGDAGPKAEAW
jgi:hypothetical protein